MKTRQKNIASTFALILAFGVISAQAVTLANGTNSVAVTSIPKDVKAKDAKVTLKLK